MSNARTGVTICYLRLAHDVWSTVIVHDGVIVMGRDHRVDTTGTNDVHNQPTIITDFFFYHSETILRFERFARNNIINGNREN